MAGIMLTVKLFILVEVFKHSSEFFQFPKIPKSSEFTEVHHQQPSPNPLRDTHLSD